MPEVTLTSELQPITDNNAFIDDDRETMIKVDHVTMEFNMASEQLNSLKEYAIAIAKRKLYFEKFTALDDISFEVKKGDVFGILGTNGSGKSTLLKIIAGVLQPTKGSCEIDGNIAPLIELGAGFDMELSARENIYLNGSLLGYSKAFIEDHFDDIVEFAEIEKFLDMPMKNYSSGMIARIAFAIATVIVPEILIVDEVLSVGDFMFQQKCENRINELIEKHGVTVLIVSHSNDQIERLCNKAIWIEKGHARIIGDVHKVCNAYRILGGRTGTKESERIVFEALQHAEENHVSCDICLASGENHAQLAINLSKIGWDDQRQKSVILVPDTSHSQAIMAAGISGVLNAPIIPYNQSQISFSHFTELKESMLSKIYLVANDSMIHNLKTELADNQLCDNIVLIPCKSYCNGIRKGLLEFGALNNLLKSNVAIIMSFIDQELSFALSGYSSRNNIPILLFDENEDSLDEETIKLLDTLKIDTLCSIGSINRSHLIDNLKKMDFRVNILQQNDDLINNLNAMINVAPEKYDTALIVSSADTQWMNFIGIGSFSNKVNAAILFENPNDLDDTARCIKTLRKIKPSRLFALEEKPIDKLHLKTLTSF